MINIPEDAIEEKRLARAIGVSVFEQDERGDPLPDGCYLAYSGNSPHYVRIEEDEVSCDCKDWIWKGEAEGILCKHILKALYKEGNSTVVEKMEEIMA